MSIVRYVRKVLKADEVIGSRYVTYPEFASKLLDKAKTYHHLSVSLTNFHGKLYDNWMRLPTNGGQRKTVHYKYQICIEHTYSNHTVTNLHYTSLCTFSFLLPTMYSKTTRFHWELLLNAQRSIKFSSPLWRQCHDHYHTDITIIPRQFQSLVTYDPGLEVDRSLKVVLLISRRFTDVSPLHIDALLQ